MSLRKCTQQHLWIDSPHYRIRQSTDSQETSFCIWQKGSYTVEAVVVVPLMALFFSVLLFLFRIVQVQAIVEEALVYSGRKTAVESSVVDSEELQLISAKGYFLYALEDNRMIDTYVEGGAWGILLLGSESQEDALYLQAHYEVVFPLDVWGIGKLSLYNQKSFQKWNGDICLDSAEEWVYVTPTGIVYHITPSCRVLDSSIQVARIEEIGHIRGKNGQKYYACNRCSKQEEGEVYYTDYGERYHESLNCAYLKRTIKKIKREEIGQRELCRFCGEEN